MSTLEVPGSGSVPRMDADVCDALRSALRRGRFTVDGVAELLGPDARAALDRGEPTPALRALAGTGDAGTLVRLFLLADPVVEDEAAAALAPLGLDAAVGAGLLARTEDGTVVAALDLRPHADDASGDQGAWWIVSDLQVSSAAPEVTASREHVLGAGAASLSLARATVRRDVGTLLDLGTGCGVQVLHAAHRAGRVTATDVSDRALALAATTFALSGLADVELAAGPWWDPVEGRRFDQIVANPHSSPARPRSSTCTATRGWAATAPARCSSARCPGTSQRAASASCSRRG